MAFPKWWRHGQKVKVAGEGVLTLNVSFDCEYWFTDKDGKEVCIFTRQIIGPVEEDDGEGE